MSLIQTLSDVFARSGIDHCTDEDAGNAKFLDRRGDALLDFRLQIYPSAQTSLLENFHVGGQLRGNGHGGAALRHIAAHLDQEGIETLELFKVRDDGLTFWPSFGALPPDIAQIVPVFKAVQERLSPANPDHEKLGAALLIAAGNPEDAWFDLTKRRGEKSVSRDTLRDINTVLSLDRTMVLELDRPVVRERLGLDRL